MPTLGEVAYLAWEHAHGRRYDHEDWLGLTQQDRDAWEVSAAAVLAAPAPAQQPSDEDRIRDAMTEAQAHPGHVITR